MKIASFFEKSDDLNVRCNLCPHRCSLKPGSIGNCRVRINENGVLIAENYGLISGMHLDPIEKKPLYHFFPGASIFSVGTVGCNLECGFCQNCDISQKGVKESGRLKMSTPEIIIQTALRIEENIGIAYTYNEPVIFYEFVYETAVKASEKGLKNVMVSNGYVQPDPLRRLLEYIDAFNIDLKAYDDEFYSVYAKARLKPVLHSIEMIRKSGRHLEITNLVIPGLNDNEHKFKEMIQWIYDFLGENTVLHLSRYFPSYRFTIPSTPEHILKNLYSIAKDKLPFTYLGNIHLGGSSDTFCPYCNNLLIQRSGYNILKSGITQDGRCKSCQSELKHFLKL
jgi:pyruvate formate lyase activating enzyme